jgi:hypothetical protein
MKIVICAGLEFTQEIESVAKKLRAWGHEVTIPKTAELILEGKLTVGQIKKEKKSGEIAARARKLDVLRYYFTKIGGADAVLVLNYDKRDITHYIGGNVLLEMGFAHVLNKKIFLLHEIPDLPYTDEIRVMDPVILNGTLTCFK